MKPATVRFYFDADILGLGKIIASIRPDATYPGDAGAILHKRQRPPCSVSDPAIDDDIWIPLVTKERLLIITRDSGIQRRVAEKRAVRESGAQMISLVSRDAKGVWDQLEVVMSQWRNIQALVDVPGPFIFSASRTALTKVDIGV